jgi:hypothetical protein
MKRCMLLVRVMNQPYATFHCKIRVSAGAERTDQIDGECTARAGPHPNRRSLAF